MNWGILIVIFHLLGTRILEGYLETDRRLPVSLRRQGWRHQWSTLEHPRHDIAELMVLIDFLS